jgi:MFS family permease
MHNFFSKTLYPWLVWVLAASFFFYKYLIQVSPGVMSSQLMSAFSLSGAGLGNLAACFFYGYLLMQIPVGILLDKWSPGKITSIAVWVCALGVLLFAHSFSLLAASLSRFLIGLSASFAAVSCFKLSSIWFPPRYFAFMAGLSMTAAMLGAICGQGTLSLAINQMGWRGALELVAFAGFVLSLLIWIMIKDKKVPHSHKLTIEPNDIKLMTKLKFIFNNKQTWLLSLYSGLAFAPVSVFGGLWGVSFLQQAYTLDIAQSANYVSLIFIGFAIGCPVTGWVSDYIGQRKLIMTLGTILALLSLTSILYLPMSLKYLSLFLFLFGLGASCFFLCFAMIREIHPLIFTATVLGFMNTFDSICEAITEPFIGKLLDLCWAGSYKNGARLFSLNDYHQSLLALIIYLIVALLLLCLINETHCKINGAPHDK